MDILDYHLNFYSIGIIPERNFRFILARNTPVSLLIGRQHEATPPVTALLGETLLAAFFLSSFSLKTDQQTVSLQLDCEGPIGRVIAFSTVDGGLRAFTNHPQAEWEGDVRLGKGKGIMVVNRWGRKSEKVYSSSVEMRSESVAKNIEEYMSRSDQIQAFCGIETVFEGTAIGRISGYLFQALPGATADDVDAILDQIGGRKPDEVIKEMFDANGGKQVKRGKVSVKSALSVRVLKTGQFFHHCDCSREKIVNMIHLLGREEAESVLADEGKIEVFCEFCKARYIFSEIEVRDIF